MGDADMNDVTTPRARPTARRWYGWVLLLAAAAVGAVFVLTAPTPDRRPSSPRRPLVSVQTLARTDHCVTVQANGRVEPVNRISLLPQVQGRVLRVHQSFVPGGRVPAGQDLITLEAAEYQAALQQAQADLRTAREELRLEAARHTTAAAELRAFGGRGVSEAQRDLATRGPQKRIKEASVARAEAKLKLAQLDLKRTRIRFPFPVVIETTSSGPGSVARAGQSLGVAYPLHKLWINVALPVDALRWFSPGEDAVLISPRGGGPTLKGRIRELRPDVEQRGSLGQILVEVTLGDRAQARLPLRAGEFVPVTLHGRCLKGVFVLPRRAVRGEDKVWLADKEQRLAIRPVRPLFMGRDVVVTRDGLEAGERLVTSELSRPVAGMAVRVAGAKDGGGKPERPGGGADLGPGKDARAGDVPAGADSR